MLIERRFSKGAEVRATQDAGSQPKLEGYAAVFNEQFIPYEDPTFRIVEIIAPGAFTKCLSDDVRALFNHDADNVLGRTTNGTLSLSQDHKGLAYTNQMDTETRIGRDVYQFVKRGDVTGCSFAFIVEKATWTEEEKDGQTTYTRTIEVIAQMFDVGPVTYPAYEQTSVGARAEFRSADLFADMPGDMRDRIDQLKARSTATPAPDMTDEEKAAYSRYTEIRTTL